MAKQISPVNVWVNGESKEAKFFSMISINDNLETSATFYYQLLEAKVDEDGVESEGASVANGNLTMDGVDYSDWGSQSGVDINTWAYDWAAAKLNLTIV